MEMIFKIIYPVNPVNLVKKRNEPIWSRRACVELRDPVHSRGIEPDCVRPNEPNFTLFLVLFLFPLCHFTFLPNEPNLQKAVSPLAIDTTREVGIVICRHRPEIFGQTLPVLPIYQDCFG
jgi:hypothetical protein